MRTAEKAAIAEISNKLAKKYKDDDFSEELDSRFRIGTVFVWNEYDTFVKLAKFTYGIKNRYGDVEYIYDEFPAERLMMSLPEDDKLLAGLKEFQEELSDRGSDIYLKELFISYRLSEAHRWVDEQFKVGIIGLGLVKISPFVYGLRDPKTGKVVSKGYIPLNMLEHMLREEDGNEVDEEA